MKKRNGFTLIELLAIIVILAIIAVITVPIILNIIDNSAKGAATDSAYGYKDAVSKYYVSKLAENKDYTIPNDTYTVAQLKTSGVNVSGKEPENNSWVTIENNSVVAGCLQFDEYKVEITNGQVGTAQKGNCVQPIPTCPGCVYAFYTTSKNYGPNGTGSVLNASDYTEDYTAINDRVFLGHILDSNGKIERAFACEIYINKDTNVATPFCIEGTTDGSKDQDNRTFIRSIWYKTNICSTMFNDFFCNDESQFSFYAGSSTLGKVGTSYQTREVSNKCYVQNDGTMYCETFNLNS